MRRAHVLQCGQHSLVCDYCGNRLHEYQAIQQGALISEQDFTAALATAKGHRWELPLERTLKCEGCGADFHPAAAASQRQMSLLWIAPRHHRQQSGELIEPEGILPFQFDADEAGKRIRAWLDELKFRPGDLDERAAISQPHKVLLPFWTFDLGGTLNWNAQVKKATASTRPGCRATASTWSTTTICWFRPRAPFPKMLLDDLVDYDTKALVPYSAELLSDARRRNLSSPAGGCVSGRAPAGLAPWTSTTSRVTTLAGETYRDFFINTSGLIIESYKLVLLPMWITRLSLQARVVSGRRQRSKRPGDRPRCRAAACKKRWPDYSDRIDDYHNYSTLHCRAPKSSPSHTHPINNHDHTTNNFVPRLSEISDLNHVSALIGWDQQTYMPPGGSAARAEQSATLQKIIHETVHAGRNRPPAGCGRRVKWQRLDPDSDEARLVSVTRRDYEKARKVPAELVAEIARVTGPGRRRVDARRAPHRTGSRSARISRASSIWSASWPTRSAIPIGRTTPCWISSSRT